MDELIHQLDRVAMEMRRVVFSPSGSNLDAFRFNVQRQGAALVFSHGDKKIKVGNFSLIDAERWQKEEDFRYPAISGSKGVRYYFYRADVGWYVGQSKGRGRIALGYWRHRQRLLAPLAGSRDADIIDTLLTRLDKTFGYLFQTTLAVSEIGVPSADKLEAGGIAAEE
jgi:hypothetical protein